MKFNGLSFTLDLGVAAVEVLKWDLTITDNSTAAKRRGRPDGRLRGDVEASGSLTVAVAGLKPIIQLAKEAGSFQDIQPVDFVSYAKVTEDEMKIEAFGASLKLGKLLDVDTNSSDETTFEVPFDITGKDFIRIDGVPYLKPFEDETE